MPASLSHEAEGQRDHFLTLSRAVLLLGAACDTAYFALGLAFENTSLVVTGVVTLAFLIAVGFARRMALRGHVESGAFLAAVSVLTTIFVVTPFFSFAWPTLALASLLPVAIGLRYLSGPRLRALCAASFVTATLACVVGMTRHTDSGLGAVAENLATALSASVCVLLNLLLLTQFRSRLLARLAAERRATREAELSRRASARVTAQTRRLLSLTSQLSRRRPQGEIAELVLQETTAVLGGSTAAIWLLDESRSHLKMLDHVGYEAPARFASIALERSTPLTDAVRTNEPVYVCSREEYVARFSSSASHVEDLAPPDFSTACLPLTVEGCVIGGLAFAFESAQKLEDDERTFLEVAAHQCAQALDRARLHEEERAAAEAARSADQRKDEFLAMLGHELRNPLAPILTALQLLKVKGVTGGEREREIIERQANHLVRLVDDLLDLSRITRGTLELRRGRVDLAVVVEKAVEMASPLLEQKRHHLELHAPHGRHVVEGDEARLAQVVQNLLTNAAKYTPPNGNIFLRLWGSDAEAVVEVTDDGEGISRELLERMFDPFVQGTRDLDRSRGGLGVGLAIVNTIVALHGGSVRAHSEGPSRGSRFTLRLPALDVAAEGGAPAKVTRLAAPNPQGRRILVVDDNRDAAEMLAGVLRSAGHDVIVTHDGPSALARAPGFCPEVALLDIGLPVIDGYRLAQELQRLLPRPARLLALTGYGQEHDRLRCLRAGFTDHLVKPVDSGELLRAIERERHKPVAS